MTAHVQGWSLISILVHACTLPQNHTYGDISTEVHAYHGVQRCDVGELVQEAEVDRLLLG